MNTIEIEDKVLECLMTACELEKNDIQMDSSLVDDLDVDSIDMVDLIYELEQAFDIEISIDEMEQQARKELQGGFEVDGKLTQAALEMLRVAMPEVDPAKISDGLTSHGIPSLYTTRALVGLVTRRIAAVEAEQG